MEKVIIGILPGEVSPSMFEVDFDLNKMQVDYVKSERDLENLIFKHTYQYYPECVEEYFIEACKGFIGNEHYDKVHNLLKIYNEPRWFRDLEEDQNNLLESLIELHTQHSVDEMESEAYEEYMQSTAEMHEEDFLTEDIDTERLTEDDGSEINPYED